MRWTINGDELYSLTAIKNYSINLFFENFIKIGSGHYQPLIAPITLLFSFFLPSFQLIHLVNLIIFSLIPLLVFININLFFSVITSVLLTLVFILSPLFYYHIFAFNAIANTFMLITNLLMIYILFKKVKNKIFLATIVFIISMFIKETFIVNFFILFLIIFITKKKSLIKTLKNLIPYLILIFLYFFIRLKSFVPSDPNYAFILTFSKLKENLLLIIPWLLNYPRGWQYGVPLPKPLFINLFIFVNFITVIFLYLNLVLKKFKVFVIILVAFLITLLPYLFLNRILVHHIDNTYFVFFTGVVFSLYLLYKQKNGLAITILIFIFINSLVFFSFTLPQWTKYSFVAVSNETALNYIDVLKKNEINSYERICIINHDKGSWPTEEGKLAEFIINKPIAIFSTKTQEIPIICKKNMSLILKNDDRNYLKVAFK